MGVWGAACWARWQTSRSEQSWNALLGAVWERARVAARSFPDPEDLVQRALWKVHRARPRLRAQDFGGFLAFVRAVVVNLGRSPDRKTWAGAVPVEVAHPDVERDPLAGARATVVARLLDHAETFDPHALVGRSLVLARRLGLPATRTTWARDVAICRRVRELGDRVEDVASDLGVPSEVVKKGAQRGGRAVAFVASELARSEPDRAHRLLLREIAERGDR
jgi:DNA-directed RNA polymerase specialized sigma24 family protein